ncbi:P2X purinoceptor 6-like [Equus przewalskii]|uniref:P2X purinoceptor 6-like n=1 Tax=Equus przewalskii TaxID=9798 RepID=A0ABM4Q3U7_EQUPR
MVTVGPVFQRLHWDGVQGAGLGPWVAPPSRPGGGSVSLLSAISPLPTLFPGPVGIGGLEFVLCFQGIKTGQCVIFNGTHRTCEIWDWCQVENDTVPVKPVLVQAENFTLFIKITVTFSKFNSPSEHSGSSALETWDATYFKHCLYDPCFSPYCPVFHIGDLVAMAGGVFEDLALQAPP